MTEGILLNKRNLPSEIFSTKEYLFFLGITQKEAAYLLHVSERTVRRWCADSESIYGPAKAVLIAWAKLHYLCVGWMPGSIDLVTMEKI